MDLKSRLKKQNKKLTCSGRIFKCGIMNTMKNGMTANQRGVIPSLYSDMTQQKKGM